MKSPPCVPGVVEDTSDIGSAEITTTKLAESAAAAAPQGQAAKEKLIREGWVDDIGTGADVTYFSGTKTLRGRETFVAVEWWAPDDYGDQERPEFVVRYLQFPISCAGIIWGPV